jgi:hypothetical protein
LGSGNEILIKPRERITCGEKVRAEATSYEQAEEKDNAFEFYDDGLDI